MKAWIASDLHLTARQGLLSDPPFSVPDADVFICAGDLSDSLSFSLQWLSTIVCPHMPVILVLGNHDYYGLRTISGTLAWVRQEIGSRPIFLLEDSVHVIGHLRFVGATLWTDYSIDTGDGQGSPQDVRYETAVMEMPNRVNDFHEIRSERQGQTFISPPEIIERHKASRAFIEAELASPFAGKTVVVSHHLPLDRSLDPRFKGNVTCASYASDLSHLIEHGRPDMWVHGHTHQFHDYRHGETRIICNPRGNIKERGSKFFKPELVIDL